VRIDPGSVPDNPSSRLACSNIAKAGAVLHLGSMRKKSDVAIGKVETVLPVYGSQC
jgi:hypothetical protein